MSYAPKNAALVTTLLARYLNGEHERIAQALAEHDARLKVLEGAAPPPVAQPDWFCDYTLPLSTYGFNVQCKEGQEADRVQPVIVGGRHAIRLLTRAGDDHVYGSNDAERCDLRLGNVQSDSVQGREWWFSHKVWFPDDFVHQPESNGNWYWGAVLDWHDDADDGGSQGPVQMMMMPETVISPDRPTGLTLQIYGGEYGSAIKHEAHIAAIERNKWYDFLYNIRWSSGVDGWCDVWLNGQQVSAYTGPTLYVGRGAYLKLANYHTAHGQDSAVVHGPVARGPTRESVTLP